jgi:hypothetical protein
MSRRGSVLQVYMGIFGMRCGSVPDSHERSMTHLEYEEAQRIKLPSLIYIIDEETHPILPKYVETGPGADALKALKDVLKKRHVVSFFTTADDLARKVLHVPELLITLGTKVEGELPSADSLDSAEIIRRFALLPKVYKGLEVSFDFTMDDFHQTDADECEALRLEEGATIGRYAQTIHDTHWLSIYACGDVAVQRIDSARGRCHGLWYDQRSPVQRRRLTYEDPRTQRSTN